MSLKPVQVFFSSSFFSSLLDVLELWTLYIASVSDPNCSFAICRFKTGEYFSLDVKCQRRLMGYGVADTWSFTTGTTSIPWMFHFIYKNLRFLISCHWNQKKNNKTNFQLQINMCCYHNKNVIIAYFRKNELLVNAIYDKQTEKKNRFYWCNVTWLSVTGSLPICLAAHVSYSYEVVSMQLFKHWDNLSHWSM